MSSLNNDWIIPDWQVPANVRAVSTTRNGGHSLAPWNSLNLGVNCGDDPEAVVKNRRVLRHHLPAEPLWLQQEHGVRVVNIDSDDAVEQVLTLIKYDATGDQIWRQDL